MNFEAFLRRPEVDHWRAHFKQKLTERCHPGRHGDLPAWQQTLASLPNARPSVVDLTQNAIQIGQRDDVSDSQWRCLDQGLRRLIPWRKGPFEVFGCRIDSEWRSDWKWNRLAPHITSLQGRRVLDVGCGNGYFGWRMLGAGASHVLGIDPSMRFLIQFQAIHHYLPDSPFDFLPIGIEDMPVDWPAFNSVFSMGVLYHRRNPVNHLHELAGLLAPGGELVLETLIVDHADGGILVPEGRYAMMRNVWSLLTVEKVLALLGQAGFSDARCVDQNVTSTQEQRRTEWMRFHSLADFLDPRDHSKTAEGYAAPKRGLFIAQR